MTRNVKINIGDLVIPKKHSIALNYGIRYTGLVVGVRVLPSGKQLFSVVERTQIQVCWSDTPDTESVWFSVSVSFYEDYEIIHLNSK